MMIEKNRNNRTRISALALSAALTMAAAFGLTAASEKQGTRQADTQARCGAAALNKDVASFPASVPNDDPELMRIDRANDHHG